jgi:aminomethyltransferase
MALYGHEISDSINVFEASLDRFCKLDKGDFLGSDALKRVLAEGGPKRKLVGLEMTERGIARDGYAVFDLNSKEIGEVTSGSPAPFLKKNIAMAYVPTELAVLGSDVLVQVRSNMVRAQIVPLPFYRRPKKQA